MAIATLASNYKGMAGKWLPYYFNPFQLGRQSDGNGSTDGRIYITQTTGTSTEAFRGSCTSDFNCDYYYTINCNNYILPYLVLQTMSKVRLFKFW